MTVRSSNSQISTRQYLAAQLPQILIPTIFNSPLCQKGQFTHFLGQYLFFPLKKTKMKILH